MKRGTQYAKKIKEAYNKFRGSAGSKTAPEPTRPIEQLVLAVLSQETTVLRAKKAIKQISEDMVDYNELRVSTPAEISNSIGRHVPRSVQRAKSLIRLLNSVYQKEYTVSFDSLASKGVREVKSYLESLDGVTPYISASVLLWSLGGHAIPVNDPALAFLKKQDLVDAGATGAEVQSFLERHISAADAKNFCLDLEALIASKPAAKVDHRKKRPVRSAAGPKASAKRKAKAKAKAKAKVRKKTKTARRSKSGTR